MKRIINLLIVVVLATLLPGCALWQCKPVYIDKVVTVYQDVPAALTEPCVPTKLIDKATYMASEPVDQNDIQVGYSLELMAVVKECDGRFKKIKELNHDSQPKTP